MRQQHLWDELRHGRNKHRPSISIASAGVGVVTFGQPIHATHAHAGSAEGDDPAWARPGVVAVPRDPISAAACMHVP